MKFFNERAQAIAPEDTPTKKSPKPSFLATANKRSTEPVSYVTISAWLYVSFVGRSIASTYALNSTIIMSQERMAAVIKEHNLCYNCLHPSHSAKQCTSSHRSHKCQKLHHTLIHTDQSSRSTPAVSTPANSSSYSPHSAAVVSSNIATEEKSISLLMTCQVLVRSPNGNTMKARDLLDTGSTISLLAERVAQSLRLHRTPSNVTITGEAGSAGGSSRSMVCLQLSPLFTPDDKISVTALTIQKITLNYCELPTW